MVKIIIDGVPVGKGRPIVTKRSAFTPTKTREYERYAQMMFNMQNKGAKQLEGSIKATVVAYYQIPKSTSKKNRALMLEGKIRPNVTPDIDNVLKIIFDSFLKLGYKDDNQIVEIIAHKYYSENPRVEVELEEI